MSEDDNNFIETNRFNDAIKIIFKVLTTIKSDSLSHCTVVMNIMFNKKKEKKKKTVPTSTTRLKTS